MNEDLTPNPTGLCLCGCGQTTNLAHQTNTRFGIRQGEHRRYIHGHHTRITHVMHWSADLWHEEDRGHDSLCWIWDRARDDSGYGLIGKGRIGSSQMAHREAYLRHYGSIIAGMDIHHLCCQPACVNPVHLRALTRAEHIRLSRITRLTVDDVREIRRLGKTGMKSLDVAARFGISKSQEQRIRSGRSWGDIST